MALSGSIGNTFRTGYRVQIDWTATQNIAANTSTITAKFYLISLGSSYTISSSVNKTVRINIDGTVYTSAEQTAQLAGNEKKLMATATRTLTHNADGTRTFTLGGEIDLNVTLSGVYYGTVSIPTTTFTLDTIPRASTPSLSASSVYYGGQVTITISRVSSDFTHTLRYNWNGYTGTIATGVATSYTWTVPTSFIGYLSNATSTTGTIYCDTYNGSTLIGTKSITLTTVIPASTPTLSASSVNYGSSVTIYTNRVHTNLTHTLKYNWNGYTGTIATGVGASYAWTIPTSFMNYIPNATSTTGTITVETYNGTALAGTKTVNLTTTVPASVVPTFDTITHSEANSVVTNAGIGAYVKDLSKLNLAITGATGAYGSTITSYKIVFDGVTYNAQSVTSNTVTTAGTLTITGTVTDSRGRTATKSVQVTVLDYSPPKITSFIVKRCLSDGTLNEMGTYASVTREGTFSTLNGKNSATIYVESAPRGSTTWTTKHTETSTTGSFSGVIVVGTYEVTSSYDFRVRVVDKFYTTTALVTMSTAVVTMSWGRTGVGIGKIWERGVLDVGGDVYIAGTLTVPSLIAKINIPSSAPPSAWPVGFVAGIVYNNGYPVSYGTIFSYKGTTGNSCVQILQAWPGSDGGEAYLYIRSARDVGTDVFGPWRKVWSENNDGHRSGLDADLLDGLHASSFVNKAGDTMTGRLIVPAGASGGIAFPNDAFGGSGDTASITLQNPRGGENQELIIQVTNDASDIVHIKTPSNNGVKINNNTVWHAGNDGAGSGLDADLLDGYHASSFLLTSGGTVSGQITLSAGTSSGKAVKSTDSYTNPAIASTSKYSASGAWVTWDYPDFAAAPIVIHRDDNNLGTKVRNVTASSCEVCMAGTATGYVRAIAIGGV